MTASVDFYGTRLGYPSPTHITARSIPPMQRRRMRCLRKKKPRSKPKRRPPLRRCRTMGKTACQFFVILQHGIVDHTSASLRAFFSSLLSVIAILIVFALLFAMTTVLE